MGRSAGGEGGGRGGGVSVQTALPRPQRWLPIVPEASSCLVVASPVDREGDGRRKDNPASERGAREPCPPPCDQASDFDSIDESG